MSITIFNNTVMIEPSHSLVAQSLASYIKFNCTVFERGFGNNNNKNTPKQESKVFVGTSSGAYFLHHGQYKEWLQLQKNPYIIELIKKDEKIDLREYQPLERSYKLREGWVPREEQVEAIEFIDFNNNVSFIPIQTGKGKTFIALASLEKTKYLTALVIIPNLIDKWVEDVTKTLEIEPEEILVVKGLRSIAGLIEMAKTNLMDSYKFIIFSNRTLQEYITLYEKQPYLYRESFDVDPYELFSTIGIGNLICDESHMHFHALFKIVLYSNVKNIIGLSATLLSDNRLIRKLHDIVFPRSRRYDKLAYDKYIEVYPLSYGISREALKRIRTTEFGSNNYSHIAFEKSIMKNPRLKNQYFEVIRDAIDHYYVDGYMEKDTCLVFVSSVAMATDLTKYLQHVYPEYTVNRFCEDDDYDNLMTGDIKVTTPMSGSTGHTVPNLRTAILTVSINSSVSNIQILGRLRKLPDRNVKFVYLYSRNIPKQVEYHRKKKEIFYDKTASIKDMQSNVGIE